MSVGPSPGKLSGPAQCRIGGPAAKLFEVHNLMHFAACTPPGGAGKEAPRIAWKEGGKGFGARGAIVAPGRKDLEERKGFAYRLDS